jgi:hypothetical protein
MASWDRREAWIEVASSVEQGIIEREEAHCAE